eukprot:1165264-Rhodomonas_salina.1
MYALLEECRHLEKVSLAHLRECGTFLGHQIDEDGCRSLGIDEELIREWMEGVTFEVGELPHYSKAPYDNIFESMEVFRMAVEE